MNPLFSSEVIIARFLSSSIAINASAVNTSVSGSYVVTYNVVDAAGNHAVQVTRTVNVSVCNRPPAVNAGGPYSAIEGGSVSVSASGSDPDGDTLTYAWDLDNNGTFETAGQTVNFSAATIDGPLVDTIRVRATDTGNLSAIAETTVEIQNAAPTVTILEPPSGLVQAVNTEVIFGGHFHDPGITDTHAGSWAFTRAADPSEVANATIVNGNTVVNSFQFLNAGVYRITLTIRDDDGAIGIADTVNDDLPAYVVIYDPNGGFVTGGGWINSPAGAYPANPSLIGKATFGFVSKYKKGATIPTGQTEFEFRVANLKFHSEAYQWLVVAGARAQYKGTGKINGAGNYGFMLTAIDGQVNGGGGVDKFRIKIWDSDSGGVVYDNQTGASDNADPATAVQGGSIVIHKE